MKHEDLYIDLALRIAEQSKCKRLQVGAVIVKGNNIVSYGWNGKVSGAPNDCECKPKGEVWKATEFETYEASSSGNIRKIKPDGKYFYPAIKTNKKGYYAVKVGQKYIPVHRIIAKTFISNPDFEFYNQVNHIDGDKLNNRPENLEWCTNRYNCEDRSLKSKRTTEDLPIGVYFSKDRIKKPYSAQVYFNGKKHTMRCASIEEAQEFLNTFKDPKDYKTFRFDKSSIYTTDPEVVHGEANAIFKAARSTESTDGATLFCTHSCCVECAKMIIQCGIKEFVYIHDYRDDAGLKLLHRAGIEVRKYI